MSKNIFILGLLILLPYAPLSHAQSMNSNLNQTPTQAQTRNFQPIPSE